jgi:hypothetical protein
MDAFALFRTSEKLLPAKGLRLPSHVWVKSRNCDLAMVQPYALN